MSRIKIIGVIILSGFLFLGAAAGAGIYMLQRPVPAMDGYREIFIKPGMTVSQVAGQLQQNGLIRNTYWFKLLVRYHEVDKNLHIGRYRLTYGMRVADILESFATGRGGTEPVTIPEGLTLPEIARILQEEMEIDSTRFMALATDESFTSELGIDAPTLEGYLFPETYHLYRQMAPDAALREMVALFDRMFTDEYEARAAELGYSVHEVLTLASIIEEEARLADEQPMISSVFHNRLKRGMRLQADPTTKYAHGRPKMRLLRKHLDHPSPYNTYRHAGLPPGPICSPGGGAIHAALYPKEAPYLYFVARGDGSHIFSKTNREHNNARIRVKRDRS